MNDVNILIGGGNFIIKTTLNRFKNILLVIFVGIILFELFMQLKFIADKYNKIYIYISVIAIIIFIYLKFSKWIINKNIINKNYFKNKKLRFKDNFVVMTFALIGLQFIPNFLPTQTENQKLIVKEEKDVDVITNLIGGSVTPAIIEEICFRGIIYLIILISSSFMINFNRKCKYLAITYFLIFSSLLFGYFHVAMSNDYKNMAVYIVNGIIFTIVFILTKNIWWTMAVHGIGNAFGILNRANYQEHIEKIFEYMIILSICILIYKYKDFIWRELKESFKKRR